ncbi:MAG: hypothetical protein U0165_18980 [Polyangiaceae bacterium]
MRSPHHLSGAPPQGDVLNQSALSLMAGLVRSAVNIPLWSLLVAAKARLDLTTKRWLGPEEGAIAAEHLLHGWLPRSFEPT